MDPCVGRCHRFPILVQLTYTSQIAKECIPADIDAIWAIADRVNERRGLTGVVGFDGCKIVQILKVGPREVARMFGRIYQDWRHILVVKLSRQRVAARSFPEIGMGIVPLGDLLWCGGRSDSNVRPLCPQNDGQAQPEQLTG
ncbi:BLUF domain-containing protein [Aureimonas sp. AU4]|uniref:BLUF domain-containing protein n=1 Tax=Aureimonas sp. AU4 TaxID=1638163 RepID=UPI0009E87CFA